MDRAGLLAAITPRGKSSPKAGAWHSPGKGKDSPRSRAGLGEGPRTVAGGVSGVAWGQFLAGSGINGWFCRGPRHATCQNLWEDWLRWVGVTSRSAGGWVSSSWLRTERGFFPVKELRFLVAIQRVKSSGRSPGCAGLLVLGVSMKKKKKSPETFHGKRALFAKHEFSWQSDGSGVTDKNWSLPPVHTAPRPAGPWQTLPASTTACGRNTDFDGARSPETWRHFS